MTPIRIAHRLPDEWGAALVAAAEQLGEALGDDPGTAWPTGLSLWSGGDPSAGEPVLVVTSLALDLFASTLSPADIAEVWRARIIALPEEARGRFHLCTIFRAVGDTRPARHLLERIRRLNLVSIELSREFGVAIADIDRALSFFGAEALQADYRLRSLPAAEAAGHVIAAALLGGDLGGVVAQDLQDKAARRHGRLRQLEAVVDRRLQRPRHGVLRAST